MSIEVSAKFREVRALCVLIPLLLLHLTLLSIQIEDPSGTFLFRKWVLQASSPILSLFSSIAGGIRGVWTGYFWLRGTKKENENLREMVRRLTVRENAFAGIEAENERLRQLLSFKQGRSLDTMGARVIGRTPDYLARVVYVDRGSSDGVRMDQAVLADNGVFGRVVLVTSHTSHVQLITNANAAVGAMVERSRSPGVLKGAGDAVLELNYINNSDQVEPNDLIVTSGLDGVFPKGLPLGRVVESRKGNSVFRQVRVAPLADLLRVEEVLILLTSTQPARN